MEKLRTPLLLAAIYLLLLGLSTLSPSIVRGVFGYEVKDPGVLLALSAASWGSGIVVWGIAADPDKHGGLAWTVIVYLVIFIVFLLWGWGGRLYTFRNVVLPLIIDVGLVIWLWSARKS